MSLLSRIEKLEKIYLGENRKPMKIEVTFVKPDKINGNIVESDKTLIFVID
jgi:hypothetical protein